MCGVFAVFSRGRPVDPERLRAALDRLRHRGPDASGVEIATTRVQGWFGATPVHVGLAHARLSILDPAHRSDQPFHAGAVRLVYNGEIYNYRDLKQQRFAADAAFATTGDTELLARLIDRLGPACLPELNGMWAFCAFDERHARVIAARDRYGKKPLFYHLDADTLCLASEPSAIYAWLGRAPSLDPADVASFLRHNFLFPRADSSTHLDGLRQVRPGSALTFDLTAWTMVEKPYYSFAEAIQDAPAPARLEEDLPEMLAAAVSDRLLSDRPVGLLLSGGVDSSLILSVLVARGLHEQVHCYIGDTGTSDDADYAQRCVADLSVAARTIRLDYGASSFDRFLKMCAHQAKPFPLLGNSMAMAEMYDAIAGDGVPVVLDGTGADEVFGGYWDRYYRFAVADAVRAGDAAWLARSLAENADDPLIAAAGRTGLALAAARRPPAPPTPDWAHFCTPDMLAAPFRDPLLEFSGSLQEALVTDVVEGRLAEWIWQNDRNAMMSSIENRSPFLDHRLAPFMGTGYAAKFHGPWNKHELRRCYDAFRPLPTQWRREKQGFRWVGHWFLRENTARALELIRASQALAPFVDVPRFVDAAAADDLVLTCELTSRLVSVAGVEAATRAFA